MAGRTQSPYLTNYAFATAPTLPHDDDGNVTFIFRPSLFVNSSAKTFSSLQVDFNNGAGYQTLTFDTPKNIIYTTAGAKTLNFKIQFTDGSVYYSYATLYVLNVPSAVAQARYDNTDARAFIFPRNTDANCPGLVLPNDEPTAFGATVTVEYGAIGNRVPLGCNPQFIKPLIVMEGLDGSKYSHLFKTGNHDYRDFALRTSLAGVRGNINVLLPSGDFFSDKLESAGYDLIFVDYAEGTGDVVRNAFLLENIIRWVNAHKINNPVTGLREQNVVLGQSMGGMVARYAVCDMEKKWNASHPSHLHHEVRLLITQDSPHRGSNLPVGFQAAANDLAPYKLTKIGLVTYGTVGAIVGSFIEMKDVVPAIDEAKKMIDDLGPRQMLIVQDGRTNTFLEGVYRPMVSFTAGYVPSFIMRALANGSECGVGQLLAPGGEILYADANLYVNSVLFVSTINAVSTIIAPIDVGLASVATSVLYVLVPFTGKNWKTKFTFNATPSTGTNQAYTGKISVEKKILFLIPINITLFDKSRTSIAGTLPWDSAPGGYYDLDIKPKNNSGIHAYPFVDAGLTLRAALAFAHAPVVSALDISTTPVTATELTAPYSNGNALSRFASFDTQEYDADETIGSTNNSRHIQFTAQNANWIFHEMEASSIGIVPNGCSYTCIGTPSSPVLSGSASICINSNGVFTISNVPSGATMQWNKSSNLNYVSGQGTSSYTIASVANGAAWVEVSIDNGCGPLVIRKDISSGVSGLLSGTAGVCVGQLYTYTAQVPGGHQPGYTYNWTYPSGWSVASQFNNILNAGPYTNFGGGILGYTVTTPCGTSPLISITVFQSTCAGGSSLQAYPNPTESNLTIEYAVTVETENISIESTQQRKIHQLSLLDKSGMVLRSIKPKEPEKQMQLNFSGLERGEYILLVYDGIKWEVIRVVNK